MKKRIYALIGGAVILALLWGVYVFMTSSAPDKTEDSGEVAVDDIGIRLTNEKDVKSFAVKNSNGEFNIRKNSDGWSVEGYDNSFDRTAVSKMAVVFKSLYAQDKIESPDDLSIYGLDKPSAVAESGNIVVNIGDPSADGKYYYVMVNNDKNVYLVDSLSINPLNYGFDDIIDKSVAKIDTNSIRELSVTYAENSGKRDIIVKYDKDNPLSREYSEKNGLATLIMEKPISNILVYPYNLQGSILMNAASLNIDSLVEIMPDDLSKYGLDKPVCTIELADDENKITVVVGDFVKNSESSLVYVLVNNRPEVFTMEYRAIKPFMEAKIADFAEKFVSIYQRSALKKITISSDNEYTVDFKAEGENDFRDIDGVKKDYRNTYINGELVDKETFTDFYELLVGIGFDDIVDGGAVQGDPQVIITFELSDGTREIDKYYSYNDTFYSVSRGGGSSMLVSKQTVRKVIARAEELSKGLDN